MAAPEANGLIFQRRFSRAYDQPIIQNTNKGNVVVRADVETSNNTSSVPDDMNPRLEAVGGILARVTLGILTVVGALVGVLGKASLDVASQFIGFMLLFVVTFMACTGTFYWWASSSRSNVKLTVKNILYIYGVCLLSDFLARTINMFSRMPPSNTIPEDISYFVSLTTMLMFSFSLLFHKNGLNAMFSRETVLFVVCSIVLNYSSSRVFCEVLPKILLPQMVHAGTLLGLSLAFAGYCFPLISPSGLYWMFHHRGGGRAPINNKISLPEISVDHSPQGSSRKVSNSSTQSRPRVSLSSLSSMNSSYPQGFDGELVSEAHGLISDLLLNEGTLPGETHQKLRRIKDILAPRFEKMLSTSRVNFGSSLSIDDDHDYESDVSSSYASSVSKKAPSHLVVQQPRFRKQRSASVVQLRRSTSKFSTTTTASGMPVLENEPVDRTRSLALRDVKARISVQEKRFSVHKMGRERLGSDGRITTSSQRDRLSSISTTSLSASNISESELSEVEMANQPTTSGQSSEGQASTSTATTGSSRLARDTSGEDRSSLEIIREGRELEKRPRSATVPGDLKLGVLPEREESSSPEITVADPDLHTSLSKDEGEETTKEEEDGEEEKEDDKVFSEGVHKEHKFYSFTKYKRPSESCDLGEYTSNEHLDMFENVAIWDYPIFELEKKAGNHILSHMAHMLFHEAGLMETFQIPQREFVNYFRALEANYGSNVYHNKTHAADVLHAVSYLMFEIIPEFSHEFSHTENTTREWKGRSRTSSSGGNIASAFSILEVLACYMASAMHDFDHPGRTNAFLVGTKSQLALLYNDRSVLENHHAASSWHLLTNFPENNFLASLEPAEQKRLRFLIIEAILATDLKMHFDLLSTFRAKVNLEEGGGIDWESEIDRLLVMQMLIKMADINTPTKSFDLHRSWSKRITEEFYQQSEEEEALGLSATIFMDRKHPEKLPAIQLSFIQHLVSPLFQACAEAGIIPGILESTAPPNRGSISPSHSPGLRVEELGDRAIKSEGEASSRLPDREDTLSVGAEAEEESEAKFMSIILTNLQINYEGWKAELPKEDDKQEEEEEEKHDVQNDSLDMETPGDLSPSSNDVDTSAPHEDLTIETQQHDTSI